MNKINPFLVYSPEDINPEEFKEIFVKEHTWINALETPKDFFIYGTRGSGKSMLLNYLELSHQLCYFGHDLVSFFQKDRKHKYIGIMVHITRERLDTERYELLIKNNFEQRGFITDLCMHDLVVTILYRIIKTFIETKKMNKYINSIDVTRVKEFCQKYYEDLDRRHIHNISFDQEKTNTEMFNRLANIFKEERIILKYYIDDKFQIKDTVYRGNYSSSDFMINFITNIKKILNLADISFYILMDNGDETKSTMQLCIDSLIAQRSHSNVCFKVAVKKGVYWNKGNIQWPHDFSQIDIDELYSTQHTVYYERIKEIANKRMELAGINSDIEDFLPGSQSEKQILGKIKSELKEKYSREYEKKYVDKIDNERLPKSDYINNRVSKYAQAELFRRLKKTGKSYAGFDNVVHLSSGVIRQFLDICSYMFDEEIKRKGDENTTKVSLKTQNDVIKRYADDFINELEITYKRLEKEGKIKELKLYRGLYFLIESLGKYYKERLMNPKFKEPRVFTFTLKDPDKDREVERILEIGVNGEGLTGCFFQSYWYSSKGGIGKYRGYAFNRRLCPRYGIDHTSFRGRIELSTDDLWFAIKNRKMPKSVYKKEKDVQPTLDLFTGGEKYE